MVRGVSVWVAHGGGLDARIYQRGIAKGQRAVPVLQGAVAIKAELTQLLMFQMGR